MLGDSVEHFQRKFWKKKIQIWINISFISSLDHGNWRPVSTNFLLKAGSALRSDTLPRPLHVCVLNFPKHSNFTVLLGCPQGEKSFLYTMSKLLLLQHTPTSSCSPSILWCRAQVCRLGTLLVDSGGDAVRHLQTHCNYLCESAKKI